jgi:GNAT superfamily N-acetyltransferase
VSSEISPVAPVPVERLPDVVDVYAEAFAGYPVMRYTVGQEGDVAARERRLIELFVTRRARRGGPAYAVTGPDGRLAGAVLLTLPEEPPAPPDVADIAAAAWHDLGEAARLRYEAYANAAGRLLPAEPHHHLNMIGVRPSQKGTGLGRRLLEFVRSVAEADPGSRGVSLSTENPRNVELYRHFGYEVIGQATVDLPDSSAGYETWGMFLRIG